MKPPTRLLSERFPVLYPVSVAAHRLDRRAHWLVGRRRHARLDFATDTPHRVVRHGSVLMRRLGDVDMALQRNKVENLRLAIRHLDGRVLRPGEELSFWRCVGHPTAGRGYLPGLVLVHGRMASAVGGGLCQLSNLLHWMVLHTTMTVVERHHHGYDPFPDSGRVVPFGSGATVFYNYVDLRFVNPGPETYRIRLWLTDGELRGELWADRLPAVRLHVREADHRFFRSHGRVYRENRLVRTAVDRRTGLAAGSELVMHNVCPVLYEPGAGVVVHEETPLRERQRRSPWDPPPSRGRWVGHDPAGGR
jgi:vancomycin resistance protein VanW